MEFGTDQLNTFDTFTLDCWKDRVYFEEQEFPAGHFATEILNFAGEIEGPLLDRITALITPAAASKDGEAIDVLAEMRPLMKEAVSWICECPPFCYSNNELRWKEFSLAMDAERFEQDRADEPEHIPLYFLSFCEEVLRILIAIYHFCLLIRAFVSAPVIKCKKTPRKKCNFVAERREKR